MCAFGCKFYRFSIWFVSKLANPIQTGKTPQTQTLTLTVKDEEKPTVVIDDPKNGTVGEEYTLPEITFSDLSGKIATSSVTLYYVGDTDEKVDFTEEAAQESLTPNKTASIR